MKKLFIASSVLLIIVLLFLGVYNIAFKESETAEISKPIMQEPTKGTTTKKMEKLALVTDEAVIGPVFDKKTETITYYSAADGTVWNVDPDGKGKRQIESTKIAGLKNVLWSPDHNMVLTTLEKDGKNVFYEYDYQTKKGTQLKSGLDTTVWNNQGTRIFYKYYDAKTRQRSLNIANADGSDWQKLTDVSFRNVSIAPVPLSSSLSFWNYPDAREETQLQIIGATGGESRTILKGKFGADYLWSLDGTRAIVSSLTDKNSKMTTLGIIDLNGQYSDLGIPTIASKCVWSMDNKTVFYALPGGVPDSAVMPNDYQDNKFYTDDTFWKIDITTGKKERIIEASNIPGKYDSKNLFLSSTEDALYFINRVDGKLYRITL